MSQALTPPLLLATGLLVIAGIGKLRAPSAAASALVELGVPHHALRARRGLVRAFAAAEIALGAQCAVRPARLTAIVIACLYLSFAAITLALARRRASCGCFGEVHAPASPAQSVLSLVLAAIAGAAAVAVPGGLGWVLARPAAPCLVLLTGVLACLYAVALAYTELPRAWTAWSAG